MTRPEDEVRFRAPERDDPQQVMSRWGTLPVPIAPPEVLEQRRERGGVTLRAVIGSAKRERQVRRVRSVALAAAAAALLAWGGVELIGSSQVGVRSMAAVGDAAGLGAHASVEGRSEIWGHDRGWVLAHAGRVVTAGDRVRALEQPVDLKLAKVTSARVAPGSVLGIVTLKSRLQELRVESGSTDFDVDPRRHAEVVVHTLDARVRVKGTAFSVSSGGGAGSGGGTASWSEVVVKRGRVEVDADGESFVLSAGESWSSRSRHTEESNGGASQPSDPSNQAEAASKPSGAQTRLDVASSGRASSGRASAESADKPSSGKGADGEELTTLSEENRLFRSALSARNAGNGGRCVALLGELMAKFPSSPLRQEAMVAHFRCLRSSGETTSARRSAARYLSEYPSGFARDEARGLVLDVAP